MNSVKQYLHFVKPYKWRIFWTIIIGIIKFAIPLLLPLILKYVIDDIIGANTLSDTDKVTKLFWVMGGAFIIFLFFETTY